MSSSDTEDVDLDMVALEAESDVVRADWAAAKTAQHYCTAYRFNGEWYSRGSWQAFQDYGMGAGLYRLRTRIEYIYSLAGGSCCCCQKPSTLNMHISLSRALLVSQ